MLTAKSSISSTPLPKILNPLKRLNPKMQGRQPISIIIAFIITDFVRLILNISIQNEIRFSNTAITVEKHAKVINIKNSVPQILPPAIFTNTFGSVTNIRAGP